MIRRLAIGVVVSVGLLACSAGPPNISIVERALVERYAGLLTVTDARRTNGIDYPAGGGVPHRYEVHYSATLTATGPVTFEISSSMERAFSQAARGSTRPQIKSVSKGLRPDPQGLQALMDISTSLWRTEASYPIPIDGTATFVETENGWSLQGLDVLLGESVVVAMDTIEKMVGYWQGGAGSCVRVVKTPVSTSLEIRAWYCEAIDEPIPGVIARLSGSEFKGEDGLTSVRGGPDGTIVASFRYPPPNAEGVHRDVALERIR